MPLFHKLISLLLTSRFRLPNFTLLHHSGEAPAVAHHTHWWRSGFRLGLLLSSSSQLGQSKSAGTPTAQQPRKQPVAVSSPLRADRHAQAIRKPLSLRNRGES